MSIYTGTGDDGTTGLFYGGRVGKADLGPEAYGSVDEAVAALGEARAEAASVDPSLADELLDLQRRLFVVAAELATAPQNREKLMDDVSRVTAAMVDAVEGALDRIIEDRGTPTEFVVPGGNALAARLDTARTVIRRAERRAVALAGSGGLEGSQVVPYLNRLADYVYMLARAAESNWTSSRREGAE
ncbi:MAG: cob(I)yrinic acid a,c-diamide adenosyltransferase [Acidimicrobiia bacterium]